MKRCIPELVYRVDLTPCTLRHQNMQCGIAYLTIILSVQDILAEAKIRLRLLDIEKRLPPRWAGQGGFGRTQRAHRGLPSAFVLGWRGGGSDEEKRNRAHVRKCQGVSLLVSWLR